MSEIDLPPPTLSADDRGRAAAEEEVASPDTLFGLSFDSVNRARQFMLAVKDLSDQHRLHLVDAVLVVKGDDDQVRVHETMDPQAGRSALSGAMWVGLLGLIVAGPVGWIAGLGIGAGFSSGSVPDALPCPVAVESRKDSREKAQDMGMVERVREPAVSVTSHSRETTEPRAAAAGSPINSSRERS